MRTRSSSYGSTANGAHGSICPAEASKKAGVTCSTGRRRAAAAFDVVDEGERVTLRFLRLMMGEAEPRDSCDARADMAKPKELPDQPAASESDATVCFWQ